MFAQKKIALIAHDNCKPKLIQWAKDNKDALSGHLLYATGTTGGLLTESLGLKITTFKSGPMGGDLQIGAAVVDGLIDCVIFFWDPLQPHPHDVDVKALLRVAAVYDIPVACNKSSADFMITSSLMSRPYTTDPMGNAEVKKENSSQTAKDIGLQDILNEFVDENKALIEKYQSGFKSILGILADKAVKKLGGNKDKEKVRQALEEVLSVLKSKELTEEQKAKVISTLYQMFDRSTVIDIFERYFSGEHDILKGIVSKIKVAQNTFDYDAILETLKSYMESHRKAFEEEKSSKDKE